MKRSENFMLQHVGGVALLTPLGAQVMDVNGLVVLNDTACCLWELLAEERTLDELVTALAERFAVSRARARSDVQTFLAETAPLGIIGT